MKLYLINSRAMKRTDINRILRKILLKHSEDVVLFASAKAYERYCSRYKELDKDTLSKVDRYVQRNRGWIIPAGKKLLALQVLRQCRSK